MLRLFALSGGIGTGLVALVSTVATRSLRRFAPCGLLLNDGAP